MINSITINIKAIINNIKNLKNKTDKEIIFTVKGNVYGFGFDLIPYVDNLIDRYAVSSIAEAFEVKKRTKKTILIISPLSINDIKKDNQFIYMISSIEQLSEYLNNNYVDLNFAIKLNVGLNRFGISEEEDLSLIKLLKKHKNFCSNILDIYTHLSSTTAFDENFKDVEIQYQTFIQRVNYIKKELSLLSVKSHATDSAYLVRFNSLPKELTSLRTGMFILGLNPIYNSNNSKTIDFPLKIESVIVDKHKVNINEYYGYEKKSNRVMYTCTIPMGYCDGISKQWINKDVVFINGTKFKFIDVAMNSSIIEISELVYNNLLLHKTKIALVEDQEDLNDLAAYSKTSIEDILSNFNSFNNKIIYIGDEK